MADKNKKVMGDLEKLEMLSSEAAKLKPVIGQAVKIRKGAYEDKTGKVVKVIIDRMRVKMMVLVDGKSVDDPLGTLMLSTRDYTYVDAAIAAKYGKSVNIKDPARANKLAINKAVKEIRTAMKQGKQVDPAQVAAISSAVAEWNKAPGAPYVKKAKKEKASK